MNFRKIVSGSVQMGGLKPVITRPLNNYAIQDLIVPKEDPQGLSIILGPSGFTRGRLKPLERKATMENGYMNGASQTLQRAEKGQVLRVQCLLEDQNVEKQRVRSKHLIKTAAQKMYQQNLDMKPANETRAFIKEDRRLAEEASRQLKARLDAFREKKLEELRIAGIPFMNPRKARTQIKIN